MTLFCGTPVVQLDFERLQVTVREGKGDKDRITLLFETLAEPLKQHLARVREAHERALREGYAGVDGREDGRPSNAWDCRNGRRGGEFGAAGSRSRAEKGTHLACSVCVINIVK